MEQIILTHLNGTTLKLQSKDNASVITRAEQRVERLGEDVVDITVQSGKRLSFFIGDKITIVGRDYTLNTPAKERKTGEKLFTYDLHFEGAQYDLIRVNYNVNVDTTGSQIQDMAGNSLTGDLKRFLDVLILNLNRVFPETWTLGTYPANTETRTETFSDSDNCLAVLQMLCSEDKYNTDFMIEIDNGGNRLLNIGEVGGMFPFTFEFGKGHGIYELTRDKVSTSNIITRLYAYGSTRNIMTNRYRASVLCLPGKTKGQSFIEDAAAIAKFGIWESTKIFDDIYPHRTGTVTEYDPGAILDFVDSGMDFDLNAKWADTDADYAEYLVMKPGVTRPTYVASVVGNTKYLIAGTTAKIHFNTGNLAGYEFEIMKYVHATKTFTLKSQTDENGYTFPSPTSAAFQIAQGDTYVFSDISMPKSYEDNAEVELDAVALDYLGQNSQPQVQYGLSIDRFFLANIVGADVNTNILWPGDYLPVKDTDLAVDQAFRLKGFTRNLLEGYQYGLTLSDMPVQVAVINRVVAELNKVNKLVRLNNLNDPAKARRNYLAAQEVLNMVFDPEGDFYTEKIKPLSIDTTMLAVGAKSMQFGLVGTMFQPNYLGAKNRVVYKGGSLTHYAILDTNGNPRVWTISDGDLTLATDAAYYIYAKCSRTAGTGTMLFSATKILADSDANFFHFLVGIINSVGTNNERALSTMYGFTTINGRFIKTGRIQNADGSVYFDLDTGEFRGNFKFTNGDDVAGAIDYAYQTGYDAQLLANDALAVGQGAQDYIDNVLPSELQSLQNQIDGVVDNWFFDYSPTASNYPAGGWTTPELKAQHEGDTFTNTQVYVDDETTPDAGKSWRWVWNDPMSQYMWSQIADSDAVKALVAASKAQDTADGKRRVFTVQPFTPYNVGDLWTQGAAGELMKCNTERLTGAYNAADWEKATKYTDDTAANEAKGMAEDASTAAAAAQADATAANERLANITSDNVLSAAEKPQQRKEWDVVAGEKSGIDSQADTFGISKSAYGTAFQNLANYLNAGVTWSSGVPTWLSDDYLASDNTIVGSTYRSKWKDYYDARTALLNAIAAKAKTLADAAQTAAGTAQTTANSKRRVFTTQPTTSDAYDVGDLWAGATYSTTYSNDLLKCKTAKAAGSSFNISHWEKASKYTDDTAVTNLKIGGRNYISNSAAEKEFSISLEIPLSGFNAGETVSFSFMAMYATGGNAAWAFLVKNGGTGSDGTTLLNISVTENTYTYKSGTITLPASLDNLRIVCLNVGAYAYHGFLKLLKAEKGSKPTDWTPAPEDVDLVYGYLKAALEGSTDIAGGLLATNLLLMKSGSNITGGFSGLSSDNIGLWTGGTYDDAIAALAKIIMRKDGSGQLAGGKINWDASGAMNMGLFTVFNNLLSSGSISFSSDALENLADISGSPSTVTSPGTITASQSNNWAATMQSGNFTLTKNSLVKFRFIQDINPANIDYVSNYIYIKNSSNEVVYQINLSSSVRDPEYNVNDYSINLPAGTYYIYVTVSMQAHLTGSYVINTITGYNGVGTTISITPITSLTKIGNNGFYSYWGASAYLYLRTDFGFQVMFGSYGIQCTTAGLKKTTNGGSTWTSL